MKKEANWCEFTNLPCFEPARNKVLGTHSKSLILLMGEVLISFLPYKCKKSLYFKGFSLYHLSDSMVAKLYYFDTKQGVAILKKGLHIRKTA